tara:strand:+ start:251 stop:478 length:228 start_codon:yes stop_codon:yes gene_type:complete
MMKLKDAMDQINIHDCGKKCIIMRKSGKAIRMECDGCGQTWLVDERGQEEDRKYISRFVQDNITDSDLSKDTFDV